MNGSATRKSARRKRPKTKLALPDLDHNKSAVLNSLRWPESQPGYRYAIDEFIEWYCSEPRLSFNRIVVTRYRIFLEDRHLAPGTINGRLAAVRHLAYEAADAGLLSCTCCEAGLVVTACWKYCSTHQPSPSCPTVRRGTS